MYRLALPIVCAHSTSRFLKRHSSTSVNESPRPSGRHHPGGRERLSGLANLSIRRRKAHRKFQADVSKGTCLIGLTLG
jgi:hypothetical protein